MESHARSIAKALSYRILGSACTAAICYAVSGRAALSLGAGGVDMVAKLGLYFLHERVWDRIGFGREKAHVPEYEI
jgi:uncharacterized membrane protein